MNANSREELFEQLDKILAKAQEDRGNTENEINTALRLAQKKLLQYNIKYKTNITLDEVTSQVKDELEDILMHDNNLGGVRKWRRHLLSVLADNFLCKAVFGRKGNYTLVGREENVEFVKQLYAYVVPQMKKLAADMYYSRKITANRKWIDSYYMGLIQRMSDRLEQEKIALENQERALMVVVEEQLDQKISQRFPRLGTLNYKIQEAASYLHGYNDGDKIVFHQQVEA